MTNVTPLLRPSKPQCKPARFPSRKAIKAMSRQRLAAIGLGGVAATLTGLSLSHLAHGIELVSHAAAWEGWAMAVGIDLGFVGLELSQLASTTDKIRDKVARWVKPAILGTLAGSAIMNAFAFAAHAEGPVMRGAGIVFGVCIPLLVYALTRIGATLYLDATKG